METNVENKTPSPVLRCKNCTAQMARNSRYCWYCGTKVERSFTFA